MSDVTHEVARRFVQDVGNTTQALGLGRVVGQIYAYLYFSPVPRNLADMQTALGISKGSASVGVRQLEQWSAVRKVWVKGDRKDYYEANDWFGRILRNIVVETLGQRLGAMAGWLEQADRDLGVPEERTPGLPGADGQRRFAAERIRQIRRFHAKASDLWNSPVIGALLR
jgi:DNA-binding transcriptional regulator GbsR (MarR family)